MSRQGKGGAQPAAAQEGAGNGAGAQGSPKSREMAEYLQKLVSKEPALVAKMLERFLRGDGQDGG